MPLPSSRYRHLAWLIVAGYFFTLTYYYIDGYRAAGRGEAPLFTDFTPIYAASLQLQQGPAENLYNHRLRYQAELETAQIAYQNRLSSEQARAVGFSAWMHPPIFMFFVLPLAFFPYLLALTLWLAVTAIPYLLTIAAITRERATLVFALAAPPTFFNSIYGQTGFLTAGLIGLGLTQIKARPVVAGICIGLASFKPHFGIFLPLALILGGHWKPFGIATITLTTLIVGSILVFGADPWYAFIGSIQVYVEGFAAAAYDLGAMNSVISLFSLAGSSIEFAWQAQNIAAIIAAALVIWAWWGNSDDRQLGLQSAVLCCATILALPMVYLYDLALLVPAIAWLWQDMSSHASRRGERLTLIVATLSIFALKPLATQLHFQAGPIIVVAILYLALSRLRRARSERPAST
jgi:alpha-1,2-mannosyltransferase